MAPIRVAIIGLSANQSWAAFTHLPYLLARPEKYQIVALCNSSKAAAEKSLAHFKLPNAQVIKTYGSPHEVAADPNVDLVVCATRLDLHSDVLKPCIEAGKDCFSEWPLARDAKEAKGLASLAQERQIRTMTGLQDHFFPGFSKLRELVDANAIGKVISSGLWVFSGLLGDKMSEKLSYMNDKSTGAFAIPLGHLLHPLMYVLGPLRTESTSTVMSTAVKQVQIGDSEGKAVRSIERTIPDQMSLHSRTESDALVSIYWRERLPFKGEPGLVWRILGETGELEIRSESAFPALNPVNAFIRKHDHKTDTIEDIVWRISGADDISSLDIPEQSRIVGRNYEAYFAGQTSEYMDWDRAALMHEIIDKAWTGYQ